MLKVEKTETYGWEAAIQGMRNPMNSWDKSDTKICDEYQVAEYCEGWGYGKCPYGDVCNACGYPVGDHDGYCSECGARVSGTYFYYGQDRTPHEKPKKVLLKDVLAKYEAEVLAQHEEE